MELSDYTARCSTNCETHHVTWLIHDYSGSINNVVKTRQLNFTYRLKKTFIYTDSDWKPLDIDWEWWMKWAACGRAGYSRQHFKLWWVCYWRMLETYNKISRIVCGSSKKIVGIFLDFFGLLELSSLSLFFFYLFLSLVKSPQETKVKSHFHSESFRHHQGLLKVIQPLNASHRCKKKKKSFSSKQTSRRHM